MDVVTAGEAGSLDRVVWVGTGRRPRGAVRRIFGGDRGYEPERAWRERLANEMNEACDEMARQGLRLAQIVPVSSSVGLQGGWTEGAWLHFARPQDESAATS
jgi:hypothetical protein